MKKIFTIFGLFGMLSLLLCFGCSDGVDKKTTIENLIEKEVKSRLLHPDTYVPGETYISEKSKCFCVEHSFCAKCSDGKTRWCFRRFIINKDMTEVLDVQSLNTYWGEELDTEEKMMKKNP